MRCEVISCLSGGQGTSVGTGHSSMPDVTCPQPCTVPKTKRRPGPPSAGTAIISGARGERLHLAGETALVSRRLVLVNDALAGDAVECRRLLAQGFFGGGVVGGADRLLHFLDRGAK